MSPVLDATAIADENKIGFEQEQQASEPQSEQAEQQEQPPALVGQLRRLTVPLPAECQTTVTLLVQQASDNLYRSGFRIARSYETLPYDQNAEELPAADNPPEYRVETIGEAVEDATNLAKWWLSQNSADDDLNADLAQQHLESWIEEFNAEAADWSIFDELADEPQAGATQEGCPSCEAACPECSKAAAEGVEVAVSAVCDKPTTLGVTYEAQWDFEQKKHELEEEIGKLSIERARLQAAIKHNRKAIDAVTEELEEHIEAGPVRLPLFDRAKSAESGRAMYEGKPVDMSAKTRVPEQEPPAETNAPNPETNPAEGETKPAASETADAWRSVTIEAAGIDPKICKILREDNSIETIGQIADYTKEYTLIDLKKIGQAKADKIEEALTAYWAAHPQQEPNEQLAS